MDDFSIPGSVDSYGIAASAANDIGPGKRPVSSMSPTIIVDSNNDVNLVRILYPSIFDPGMHYQRRL